MGHKEFENMGRSEVKPRTPVGSARCATAMMNELSNVPWQTRAMVFKGAVEIVRAMLRAEDAKRVRLAASGRKPPSGAPRIINTDADDDQRFSED